jgi:hypothetical protein
MHVRRPLIAIQFEAIDEHCHGDAAPCFLGYLHVVYFGDCAIGHFLLEQKLKRGDDTQVNHLAICAAEAAD